jgi:hypothetical protein
MTKKLGPGAGDARPRDGDVSGRNNPHIPNRQHSFKIASSPRPDQPTHVLRLRPAPGRDPIRSLRALLKFAWRQLGLRCLSAIEQETGGRRRRQ